MRVRFVMAEIWHGFRSNASMIWAVILVTFVSLSAVGSALMVQRDIDRMKQNWYSEVEVQVWMCAEDAETDPQCGPGGVTPDQLAAVEAKLKSPELSEYVENVKTASKEETYKAFLDRFQGSDLEEITQAAIPPVIHVQLRDAKWYQVVAQAVADMPGVWQVYDQSKLFAQLFSVLGKMRLAALAVAGVLALAAVLLIATTIRLSALSRQRETGIMRLVGASNLFIMLPFMLEGAVAALLGSLLAVGALWSVTQFWLQDWVAANFSFAAGIVRSADVLAVAPWLVLAAVVLAGLSSALTLRRFTRV
jgi:cell division transport system permease protein